MHTCRQHEGERGHQHITRHRVQHRATAATAVAAGWKWVGAGRDTHRSELFEDQLEEVAAPTWDQHAQGSNLARAAAAEPTADQPVAINNTDIKVSDGGKEEGADDTGKARAAPCCAAVIIATAV